MELTLGANKVVQLTPWNSKTKKDFIKVFKQKKENVSEQDVINTLVSPYINTTGIYYSADELQYMLVMLRKISIDADIKFSIDCECGKDIDVESPVDEMIKYTPSQLPVELNDIAWKDIQKPSSVTQLKTKYPDETSYDIVKLMHISNFKGTEITNFETILDISDNLTLDEDDSVDDDFNSVISKLEIGKTVKCVDCGVSKEHTFEIIPSFFDPLLPKK